MVTKERRNVVPLVVLTAISARNAMTGKRVPHQDRTREIIGVWSSLVPREKVQSSIAIYES